MPSIKASKAEVKDSLATHRQDVDHGDILASLQSEIDNHNAARGDGSNQTDHGQHDTGSRKKDMRFRFKRASRSPDTERSRRHRTREHHSAEDRERRTRKRKRSSKDKASQADSPTDSAHPFPREPADPDQPAQANPNAAFRDSLFDALADDEGAAYWENVYSQPIHVFPRPTVQTATGELEQMNDDDYAAYVQTKMWEKKHPHIVQERQRKAREKKQQEEETARRREEFIRRQERAAWDRMHKQNARMFAGDDAAAADDSEGPQSRWEWVFDDEGTQSRYEYHSDADGKAGGGGGGSSTPRVKVYEDAWRAYLAAWDALKRELLARSGPASSGGEGGEAAVSSSQQIAWPVLRATPVTRPNIEAFMRNMPVDHGGPTRLQLLKAERVRWHPDKIQQRFGGDVDDATMKLVTSVFQVVDSLLEEV